MAAASALAAGLGGLVGAVAMSWEEHDDDCPGCRPVVIDPRTMVALPEDSPVMRAILGMWAGTDLAERQAWHRFTCGNSRAPSDLRLVDGIRRKMQEALAGIGGASS
jgi:hypothetical protein